MIDTKKAREMRARILGYDARVSEEWDGFYVETDIGSHARCTSESDATVLAYSLNALVPFADEIERLTRREERLVEETWNLGSELEPLRARILSLESQLARAHASAGPMGVPPIGETE